MWSGFGQTPVFSSPPVKLNGKVSYVGHATTIYSIEQSIEVLDWIGARVDSEDCLPFAVTLVEDGELVSIAEDNGEFGSGELLAESLNGLDGFNALVCVSRKVSGMYPTDMVEAQKLRCIRAAGIKALELLYDHLRPAPKDVAETRPAPESPARMVLQTKKVTMQPPAMNFEEQAAEKRKP